MTRLPACVVSLLLVCVCGTAAWAVYAVRISDLSNTPLPPNPIKVWGKVTSISPVKISDGTSEITVLGLTASVGDFVVVTGDWSGGVLTVAGPPDVQIGDMIYIPAGVFLMGNSNVGDDAAYRNTTELPQHSVYLSAYWIGKHEVTRGAYRAFMDAGGYSNWSYWSTEGWSWRVNNGRTEPDYWAANQDWASYYGFPAQPFTQTDSHPVVGVTYYEAEAFCNWAGGHLPTEEQWEKAARWTGSHPNVYPWGDEWDAEKCNNYYDQNAAGGGYKRCQTAPVGSYSAGGSPYGCQDIAGNVWEWCQDWCKSYPGSGSPFDYTNSYRVLRGGSWTWNYAQVPRCAWRHNDYPYNSFHYFGFRLAR
jgi:gamma-glutamyl hercynylcysteine S-oxide synthase